MQGWVYQGMYEAQVKGDLISEGPPVLAGPPGHAGLQVERAPEGGVRDGNDPVHPHLLLPSPPLSHLQAESSELEEGEAETEDVDDHPQDVWNILTEWALQRYNMIGLVGLRCFSSFRVR